MKETPSHEPIINTEVQISTANIIHFPKRNKPPTFDNDVDAMNWYLRTHNPDAYQQR